MADDAAITFGGNPKALAGHKSVRMVRERVVVTVEKGTAKYDCTFYFQNQGAPCKVRIGFPDRGRGADETSHMEDVYNAKEKHKPIPAYQNLGHFRSWVDGKEVKTVLIPVGEEAASWHTKVVAFKGGQTRVVRDTFVMKYGSGLTSSGGAAEMRTYVMSTGASWKGNIGDAEVIVRFAKGVLPGAPKPIPAKITGQPQGDALGYKKWASVPKNGVLWSGFAMPSVRGNELRFHRRNFKPTQKSDIWLYFGFRKGIS